MADVITASSFRIVINKLNYYKVPEPDFIQTRVGCFWLAHLGAVAPKKKPLIVIMVDK